VGGADVRDGDFRAGGGHACMIIYDGHRPTKMAA